MNSKSVVKSAFAPIKTHFKSAIADTAATNLAVEIPPEPKPNTPVAAASSPLPESTTQTITTELWVQLVNDPLKNCPCWAFLGNPHKPLFCSAITIVYNTAHWPAHGAVARKDFQALRWLGALALLERLALSRHPITDALRSYLLGLVSGRRFATWETVLWAAYLLRNLSPFTELDHAQLWDARLERGASQRHKFGELTFSVDSEKLANWHTRNIRQKG
jgi:hypothetical protein